MIEQFKQGKYDEGRAIEDRLYDEMQKFSMSTEDHKELKEIKIQEV